MIHLARRLKYKKIFALLILYKQLFILNKSKKWFSLKEQLAFYTEEHFLS